MAAIGVMCGLWPQNLHAQDVPPAAAPAYQPVFGPDGRPILPQPAPAPQPQTPAVAPVPAAAPPAVTAPARLPQSPPPPSIVPAPAPEEPPAATPPRVRPRLLRVAVYDLSGGAGIPQRTTVVVSEALLAEVRKLDGVTAVGMKEIMEMLAFEQKKQFVGCDSVSCLVELAGALGVDELLTGSLGALGESHVMTVKRLDLATAETKRSVSRNLKKGDGEEFLSATGQVVEELYPDVKPRAGVKRGVTKDAVARLTSPPLPRWVFFATTGAGIAALGLGGLFGYNASVYFDDYNNLMERARTVPTDAAEIASRKDKVDSATTVANVMFIAGGALLAAAGIEAIFTDWKPEPVRATVTPVLSRRRVEGAAVAWTW
jgi:hypothetical protein